MKERLRRSSSPGPVVSAGLREEDGLELQQERLEHVDGMLLSDREYCCRTVQGQLTVNLDIVRQCEYCHWVFVEWHRISAATEIALQVKGTFSDEPWSVAVPVMSTWVP